MRSNNATEPYPHHGEVAATTSVAVAAVPAEAQAGRRRRRRRRRGLGDRAQAEAADLQQGRLESNPFRRTISTGFCRGDTCQPTLWRTCGSVRGSVGMHLLCKRGLSCWASKSMADLLGLRADFDGRARVAPRGAASDPGVALDLRDGDALGRAAREHGADEVGRCWVDGRRHLARSG